MNGATAAINLDWAIAEKVTGAWLLCKGSSALQCPAQSNYWLRTEFRLQNTEFRLQNIGNDPIWFTKTRAVGNYSTRCIGGHRGRTSECLLYARKPVRLCRCAGDPALPLCSRCSCRLPPPRGMARPRGPGQGAVLAQPALSGGMDATARVHCGAGRRSSAAGRADNESGCRMIEEGHQHELECSIEAKRASTRPAPLVRN